MYKQMLDEFLHKVEKPGRYTGGELNCEIKNTQEAEVRFAFCFLHERREVLERGRADHEGG